MNAEPDHAHNAWHALRTGVSANPYAGWRLSATAGRCAGEPAAPAVELKEAARRRLRVLARLLRLLWLWLRLRLRLRLLRLLQPNLN